MRFRPHPKLPVLAAVALGALALPAQAAAEHRPRPFDTVATIAACGGESLTVGFEIEPASGEADRRAARRAERAVRGARLLLRFEAAPLYGSPRTTGRVDLGRTTSGRRFERFADLPAQTYTGVVRYRWVRGKRTVLSGVVRTRKGRAAGRRGRASCSLEVGKPPVDTTPPFILPVPFDSAWKRGPLNVQLHAVDDLSGVALVLWRLDGGPVRRGRSVQITTEGVHRLVYIARDAAGNQTKPAAVTLRVDTNAPSAPAIGWPSGTTTDATPEIRWSASTDSASGVRSYIALVRNAGGAIVWSRVVAAAAPTALKVGDTLAPGQYTAEVYAFDGAAPQPFSAKSTTSFSIVDAMTPTPADSDADGRVDTADNCPFAANADQLDTDGDRAGDACDADDDADGDPDADDNCALTPNPTQANLDGDAQGDACDADDDGDGVPDASDNCPVTANPNQANFDGDAQGDACDTDDDNDGLLDGPDPNDNDTDSDDDTILDGADACPGEHRGLVDTNNNGCPDPG
ncbi:MAG: hypothetical protein QOJ22_983 [Thermoleophilaceae bacterium]|jgi:hypothetical protein|nr:hypothetical protein [Thermoleophilaceae bacterium]